MKLLSITLAALLAFATGAPALAADAPAGLSAKKQTKLGLYMTAKEAFAHVDKHGDKTLFLDIRTPGELNYLGAADAMDYHVPAYYMDRSKWDAKKTRYIRAANKTFIKDVEDRLKAKGLSKADTVILMCRSGKRSASAINKLAAAGFTKAYTVTDGYEGDKDKKGMRSVNGWKNANLPWTYRLNGDVMYLIKE